ncbi:MAG TPA: hypothetical protein VN777_11320 [Terriglobales bacterium]|nr:hypothetical protein [Terriglobales bacterium]
MRVISKALVFLLLAAVMAAPRAAQGLRSDNPAHEPAAGCHEDGGSVPAPAPTSHSCCQAGHSPAILQQSSTLQPSLQVSAQVEFSQNAAAVAAFNLFPSFVFVSGGPPLLSPLRV